MDILSRIKRLIVKRRYRFSEKAADEMYTDGLEENDVLESILSAQWIKKTMRSRNPRQARSGERLYVIESFNYSGTLIYTKGKIAREQGEEIVYLLVSSKIATLSS